MRLRPDVIVTDLSMPGLSGLDVLKRLKAEHIASKVIVLTMPGMGSGGAGPARRGQCLPAETLRRRGAVDRHPAGAGGPRVSHAGADQGSHRADGGLPDRAEPQLTARQRDVLRLILEGRRMKEIAREPGAVGPDSRNPQISDDAVLGVNSTAELVKYAIEHRLIAGLTAAFAVATSVIFPVGSVVFPAAPPYVYLSTPSRHS